jgi:hypothetical protein
MHINSDVENSNDAMMVFQFGASGSVSGRLHVRVFGTAVSFAGLVGYFLPIALPSPLTTP